MSVLHALYISAASYEIGTGRAVPSAAALVGLAGVVIGGLAVARAGRSGTWRRGAVVALAAGLISAAVGGVHAAYAAGGLGTGNGLAGAVMAVVLGVAGMAAGGLALARARRAG